jgi:hypothetical protein
MNIHNLIFTLAFLKPIAYDSGRFWMLLPLSLAVATVYKATRTKDLRSLPIGILLLWLTIIGGMLGVAVLLYIIILIFQ